ncbi:MULTISPECIES: hypothetical protein [unclassified Xanthobacter]|uniref:hypothetical protein n=1 Tax=unclassified Xanthobacter TaxID=2623496 RepID=UPI001F35410F|nr:MULTISPECIES: hypothetical protein [unclassified Xanthobacter]
MSTAYASTFSLNLSVAQTETVADSETTSLDTTSLSLDVNAEASPSTSGESMAITLGGDAIAIGEDTLATAQVDVSLSGDADMQTAYAFGEFTAWGSGDASSYAAATSYVDFIGDADYTFDLNYTAVTTSFDGSSSEWSASALTEVFALDIDGIPTGEIDSTPLTADTSTDADPVADMTAVTPDCGCGNDDGWDMTVDGNLALFDVTATAVGDDSFTQVDFSALTVEDQLSTVSVVVTAAIG